MSARRAVPLIALAMTSCAPTTTAAVEPVPLGDAIPRCAEEYTPAAVGQRAFAFDGTVIEIGGEPAAAHADSDRSVTFAVHEWFVADGGESVKVQMMSPGALTSVDNVAIEVGTRLLVSGEPRWGGNPLESAVAWACGFTRTHTAGEASQWRATFSDAPGR